MGAQGEQIQASLKEWLETNLTQFLTNIRGEFQEDPEWQMPIIEDYVLCVAVRDLKDNGSGVFAITAPGSSTYRITGLLQSCME